MKIKLFLVALACSIFIGAGIGAGLVVTNHPEGDFNHESKEFIFNCYLYAGFRIDEIEWQIEKGLKELLEPSASEGQIGKKQRTTSS